MKVLTLIDKSCSFVYGGYLPPYGQENIALDTIHILTLPAFNWIQVPYNPQHPRTGHTCSSVGGSQLIVIGGLDPSIGYSPNVTYGLYSTPDPFIQGVAIFDMTELTWSSKYTANAQSYKQSAQVESYYFDSSP